MSGNSKGFDQTEDQVMVKCLHKNHHSYAKGNLFGDILSALADPAYQNYSVSVPAAWMGLGKPQHHLPRRVRYQYRKSGITPYRNLSQETARNQCDPMDNVWSSSFFLLIFLLFQHVFQLSYELF
jgi:hypothetical protein